MTTIEITYAERFAALARRSKADGTPRFPRLSQPCPGDVAVVWSGQGRYCVPGCECGTRLQLTTHDNSDGLDNVEPCDCGGSGRVPIPYGLEAAGAMLLELIYAGYDPRPYRLMVERNADLPPDQLLAAALVAALEHIAEEEQA